MYSIFIFLLFPARYCRMPPQYLLLILHLTTRTGPHEPRAPIPSPRSVLSPNVSQPLCGLMQRQMTVSVIQQPFLGVPDAARPIFYTGHTHARTLAQKVTLHRLPPRFNTRPKNQMPFLRLVPVKCQQGWVLLIEHKPQSTPPNGHCMSCTGAEVSKMPGVTRVCLS